MKLLVRRMLGFLAWSPLIVAAGCGNQGEGERCDPTNQSIDCDYGLECKKIFLNGYHSICCPISGVASSSACNASGAPPMEAGVRDGATDGNADAASDAGADASSDRGGNDAVTETTVDRAPDNTTDTARDNVAEASIDSNGSDGNDAVSTPDQASDAEDETSIDAPEPDASDDTTADAIPDVSADGVTPDTATPLDVIDVTDVGDAVTDTSADGPG
jgi:hypothetical protein